MRKWKKDFLKSVLFVQELTYQYWPDETSPSRTNIYGNFKVTSRTTRTYADHTVRVFLLENVSQFIQIMLFGVSPSDEFLLGQHLEALNMFY